MVDSGKHRVLKMNDRMEWEVVCGGKSRGNNDDQLDCPQYICFDKDDNM